MALLGLQPHPGARERVALGAKPPTVYTLSGGAKTLDPWDFEKALPPLGLMVAETRHSPYC